MWPEIWAFHTFITKGAPGFRLRAWLFPRFLCLQVAAEVDAAVERAKQMPKEMLVVGLSMRGSKGQEMNGWKLPNANHSLCI